MGLVQQNFGLNQEITPQLALYQPPEELPCEPISVIQEGSWRVLDKLLHDPECQDFIGFCQEIQQEQGKEPFESLRVLRTIPLIQEALSRNGAYSKNMLSRLNQYMSKAILANIQNQPRMHSL